MSGIIKSQNLAGLAGVRPFEARMSTAEVVVLARQDEERERLQRTIADLETELRRRDAKLDALRADVERAFADGKAKGREAGLAEARDLQDERLAVLEAAARAAQSDLASRLASLERLAPLLARECLDKIFEDHGDRAGLVADAVAAQMARIERDVLIRIEVSRLDFAGEAALTALASRLSLPSVRFEARDDLPAGGCVMVLRLGRMAVGIDQQWGSLRDLLGVLAEPEDAA